MSPKGVKVGALAAAAVVVVLLIVLLATRKSDDLGTAAPGPSSSTSTPGSSAVRASSLPPGSEVPGSTAVPETAPAPRVGGDASTTLPISVSPPSTPPPTVALPLNITVGPTSGVHDGQSVPIRVTPTAGSQAFGFEAYLCRGDATYRNDADIRPLQTGKCAIRPFSPNSDQRVEVVGQAPYTSLEGTFRVGAGSQTFNTPQGPATVTCGPANPCVLVLKLQYPNGYGFQAIPVTYG